MDARWVAIVTLAAAWSASPVLADTPSAMLEKGVIQPAPLIVSTMPKALANDVDPELVILTVTFDSPMMDQSWSWTGSGTTYPKTTGLPYYDADKRTCTLPVKLEPGKVYWVGINSPSYRNFVSKSGQPAKWYAILFATKSADGKPTPIPEEMVSQASAINKTSHVVLSAASGNAMPPGTTRLSYVKDSSTDKRSLDGSGHAVLFERPSDAKTISAGIIERRNFIATVKTDSPWEAGQMGSRLTALEKGDCREVV